MMKKSAYLVGIKGVAMTALAIYLKQAGFQVSGSDVDEIFPTDMLLKRNKIRVKNGFDSKHIDQNYDVVVVTGAHKGKLNIEAQTAVKKGLKTYMHGEYLGLLMNNKKGISVCGCHGKTTTSSMIASILTHANRDPSYLVGTSFINDLGAAGHFGKGDYFIAEADEYMTCPKTNKVPRFFWQNPEIAVITNIEFDHPDEFKNIDDVKKTFLGFTTRVKLDGTIIACIDNIHVSSILPQINRNVITYGFSPRADFRIEKYKFSQNKNRMSITYKKIKLADVVLKVPGKHNLLNALAAIIVTNIIGLSFSDIKKYLQFYTGSNRRFELIAMYGNKYLFDDYAHHPSEISATIRSIKEWYPLHKLIIIFQPHTFSRTKYLFKEFARSFLEADKVIVTDIFPSAREKYDSTVSSQILVAEINKNKHNALYMKDKMSAVNFLQKNPSGKDLIITMGAGDLYRWHESIKKAINLS